MDDWVACAIDHFEASALNALSKQAPKEGAALLDVPSDLSYDLGMRRPQKVELTPTHVRLLLGEGAPSACVSWKWLAKIAKKNKQGAWQLPCDCDDVPERIEGFSEATNRAATLMPVEGGPPTAVLGGFVASHMRQVMAI